MVVNESKRSGKFLGAMKSKNLSLTPKQKDVILFDDNRLISCCNVVYKVVSKITENRLKPILNKVMSEE